MNNPIIRICGNCAKYDFPEVDKAIQSSKGVAISHGFCLRHYIEELNAEIKRATEANESCPDLAKYPELVRAYSHGIFTQQQALTERLKRLANIHS